MTNCCNNEVGGGSPKQEQKVKIYGCHSKWGSGEGYGYSFGGEISPCAPEDSQRHFVGRVSGRRIALRGFDVQNGIFIPCGLT